MIYFHSLITLFSLHIFFFFFFNDTATTEIYTLSLHDALPISRVLVQHLPARRSALLRLDLCVAYRSGPAGRRRDRKSTRLNSSHLVISYAVFCLKKKKNQITSEFVFESGCPPRRVYDRCFHRC